jgi:hypothetical protein
MRALIIAVTAGLIAAACGGAAQPAATSAPTAPPTATPAPTPATSVKFTADLKTENEVPPIANDEKVASGKAIVTFDLTRDATGKLTGAKASIDVTFAGLPAGTAITIGHIHGPAPAGTNAGVKVGFKTDADNPLPLTGSTAAFKKADVTVEPDLAQQIIDKPGDWYVNFHSKLNPGGVVRGQMVKG